MNWLRAHIKIPFYANAYSLILLQGLAAGMSVLFWVIVVRILPVAKTGLGTALYSAAMLVVWLSSLGLDEGLGYHLPRTSRPEALINFTFSVTTALAVLFALVFIAGAPFWSPELAFLRPLPAALAFIACAAALQASAMQDTLFVAERSARFVLLKGLTSNVLIFPFFFGGMGISQRLGLFADP